jgi:hypothetical protein
MLSMTPWAGFMHLQEKFCRVYTRDSSQKAVQATQEAFRNWHKERFRDRAVQLRTPLRKPRETLAAAVGNGPTSAQNAVSAAAAAGGNHDSNNPRKRNLDGQFRALAR